MDMSKDSSFYQCIKIGSFSKVKTLEHDVYHSFMGSAEVNNAASLL